MIHNKEHYPFLYSLVGGSKKTATLVTLGLLVSISCAAFPAMSHAVVVDPTGSVITMASATSNLISKLSETGFYQAVSLVFLSEIGDKTFFIAGLLAMKTSKVASFLGSMGALTAMTLLSVLIGQIFHAVPSGFGDGIPLDDIAACLAFAFFGIKTLKESLAMEEGASVMDEELAEAEEEVENSESVKQTTAWYVKRVMCRFVRGTLYVCVGDVNVNFVCLFAMTNQQGSTCKHLCFGLCSRVW